MEKPIAFRGLVGALTLGQKLGAVPLTVDPDTLEAAAKKRVKLSDFGDPYYRKGLEILCDSLNREAGMNAYGVVLARDMIVNFLATRLCLQDMRNRNAPELKTDLIPPIIVTGLARTGTTALHRMLAAAPGHRGLEWWELMSPVPRGPKDTVEARVKFAKGLILPRKIFTPHLDAAHYIREDTLEECFWMMGQSFASRAMAEVLPCPSYIEYFLDGDHRDKKYEDYADLLRVMQARVPGKRLVMKSPEHMDALPELARHLPEAMIVMTHRKPTESVPSYISLSDLVHSLGVKERDVKSLGKIWLDNAAREVEKHMACRQKFNNPLWDHRYTDMLEDPIGSVRRVYERFGMDWTDETAETVAKHTRENQQHKYGHHKYHISDFGLTDADVAARFGPYVDQFNP
ncbi:sulfotransferase [Planktotalea sp.]|uniref:sulfotransferase family protein n=1 Tax=Planktotalea sp. TaxID=2029877 RepID=UPI003D6C5BF9